jgi:hypothetical protein
LGNCRRSPFADANPQSFLNLPELRLLEVSELKFPSVRIAPLRFSAPNLEEVRWFGVRIEENEIQRDENGIYCIEVTRRGGA